MTPQSEHRSRRSGAKAANQNDSDTEGRPSSPPRQANATKLTSEVAGSTEPPRHVNPRPILATELDDLLGGTWPGELRRLMDPEQPLPLAIGTTDAVAAGLGLNEVARSRLTALIMRRWTATGRYLRAPPAARAVRHGIDGTTSPVSPEHAAGRGRGSSNPAAVGARG